MKAALRTLRKLYPLLNSKPVVTICISGREELDKALQEAGARTVVRDLGFNHRDWVDAPLSKTRLGEDELEMTSGFHLVKNPGKHPVQSEPVLEEEVLDLLALLLKQHKREFLLNKKNYYLVLQDTAHTGVSLQIVKKALMMNGIPGKKIVTAAFRSSISPVFPPDFCGEKTILRPPRKRSPDSWVRIEYGDSDLVLNIPKP